jgi:hypothetical protein
MGRRPTCDLGGQGFTTGHRLHSLCFGASFAMLFHPLDHIRCLPLGWLSARDPDFWATHRSPEPRTDAAG